MNSVRHATPTELQELQRLNKRLKSLQDKLLNEAVTIDRELNKRVKNIDDALDDYEIELEISFFLKESDPIYNEDEDNIIVNLEEYVKNISNQDISSSHPWSTNHNEFGDEYHCWWFHALYDHKHLSMEEMLKIGKIWGEIKVAYQYFDEGSRIFTK